MDFVNGAIQKNQNLKRRKNKLNIDLYTTHCPQCTVLERKLAQKNITYTEHNDIDEMIKLGYNSVPILVIDGNEMPFGEAIQWVNSLEE